jgi:lipopolysaccharide transport system ATP-binding protein
LSLIALENIDLEYPVRPHRRLTLKDFVLRGLFRKNTEPTSVRALSGLNLRVTDGERVGIIGRNGAGKSTLLRTIAGVYPIARGRRHVQGSVCSLFDIAVGFEPDATGWQNIFYRSYLQGETPRAVQAKLHGIGAFSELGDFLDMPLRSYSTGMTLRLAFSVATSSDPEILLIDEFFSTGDLGFQKKGEERMRAFIQRAHIVLMVGHNLGFLEKFCNRVIWLHQGQIIADGPAPEIIKRYVQAADVPLAAQQDLPLVAGAPAPKCPHGRTPTPAGV